MALTTGERALHLVAMAKETTHGTGVNPTAYANMESSGIIDLDRAMDSPQEDYGKISRHQPNRSSYGVKLGRLPLRGVVRFEDLMHYLATSLAGGVTPSTVATGVYLWAYAGDDTGDTLDSKTIEEGDNIQAYRMTYSMVERLRLSFNALAAPGNSPWSLEVDFIGRDKVPVTFGGTPATVSLAETAMGHLSTMAIGSTATAFASLAALSGLLAFDVTINTGVVPRKWGGTTDVFDTHGRLNRECTFTATFFQLAATKTAIFDVFDVAGAQTTDQRIRIACTGTALDGSNNKQMLIDARARFSAVPVQENNGATIYAAAGTFVDDATLASDVKVSVQNGIATLP